MKVAVGCDHGGIVLKESVVSTLEALGATVEDLGTYDESSVDYPVYGLKVAKAVASGQCDCGVVMCGTGIGISIAANKVKGIRAAVVTNDYMAEMTKRHNDANFIAFGGRVEYSEKPEEILDAFIDASFEGGRHERRIAKMMALEGR